MKKLPTTLICEAYASPNPVEHLESLSISVTRADVDILTNFDPGETPLKEDLKSYLGTRDKPAEDVAWKTRFIYFATSLSHVFMKNDRVYDAVVYLAPNRPYPYVWIDFDGSDPKLVKHTLPEEAKSFQLSFFKVFEHMRIEMTNYTCDLAGCRLIKSVKNGSFVQISSSFDKVHLIRAKQSEVHCAFLLTFKKSFCGIYVSDKTPVIYNAMRKP
jgi:hypothetical protein